MRIGKKGEPVIHPDVPSFAIGRAITIRNGTGACLISTGTMAPVVMAAAEILARRGISARVESFHTVKPLDEVTLAEVFSRFPVVAVVEEHGRIGGLAGGISEWLAARGTGGADLLSFGTRDEFMHEVGSQEYARRKFGLTAENIAEQVAKRVSAGGPGLAAPTAAR
jgi:transketolase